MLNLIIAIICIILAGACKGASDILQHKYKKSIFAAYEKELFYNPKKSWKNKWKFDPKEEKFVERFPGSSTFFVFTTDAWHLCNFFMYKMIFLIVILQPSFFSCDVEWYISKPLDFIVFHSLYTGSFEICYRWLFIRR